MQIATSVFSAICLTVASAECFRVLQAASYKPLRGYCKIAISVYYFSLIAVQIAAIMLHCFVQYALYINPVLYLSLAVVWSLVKRKVPLKLTKRVLRMFVTELAILVVLCVAVNPDWWTWLLPITTLAAWAICLPVDIAINHRYIRLAQSKLSQSGVVVIAITGSYGKTSVKDMLSAILSDSVAPSGSCNTPLGIASFINKTDLTCAKYLILEFGARQKGDIAKLCKLYHPSYGIVTGVCAQHLSTFKSLANVVSTKKELVENIPKEGFCVLNQRNEIVSFFAESGVCRKIFSYENLQINVGNVDFDGTQADVIYLDELHSVTLPQISDYVGDTFAMCFQMAINLGQSVCQTIKNAANIRQTPHRLELIKGAYCHVLDDSYNGSITGVDACCKTLAKFSCAKVVITQGLVECGKNRREMNIRCGKFLGKACDAAVVLGRNADFLAEGLRSEDCKVLRARSLSEAVQLALPLAHGGILLFQNDLPDVVGL